MAVTNERIIEVCREMSDRTRSEQAVALGLSEGQLRTRLRAIRIEDRKFTADEKPEKKELPKSVRAKVPLSEDERKFHEDWTPQDCIDELLRIANIDTTKVVTRNYFRNCSDISESTWNRYFGTFEEYKRQAGVKLTRQQHQLEREIAKHASVDHYRDLNKERSGWGDKYIRSHKGKWKTVLFCSDLHDVEIDPFFLEVLIDTARRLQPDVISFVGDVFDLPEFGRYTIDPREWDVVGRIRYVHEYIFKALREVCPDAQFDLVEGNHEARLLKHLADQSPAMRAVLADLHGMTVASLLGLEQFQMNYVAQSDLAAWTKRDHSNELAKNHKIYWGAMLAHHFPWARTKFSMPGVNGHCHRHFTWQAYAPAFGSYEWHQMGAGHMREASYCEAQHWSMGFAIGNCNTETKSTCFEYITVNEEIAVSGGKWYYRRTH